LGERLDLVGGLAEQLGRLEPARAGLDLLAAGGLLLGGLLAVAVGLGGLLAAGLLLGCHRAGPGTRSPNSRAGGKPVVAIRHPRDGMVLPTDAKRPAVAAGMPEMRALAITSALRPATACS